MNCRSFQRRFQSMLDERLRPEEDVVLQKHAWKCVRCQQLLEGQQRLWEMLADDSPPALSPDVADAIVARLHEPTLKPSVESPRVMAWRWLAIAASVLILLSPLALNLGHKNNKPENKFANRPLQPPQQIPVEQFAQHPELPTELTQQEYQKWLEMWREVPMDEIGVTLRPITASFGVTIDALRKTLPLPSKDESQSQKPQAGALRIDVFA